jgi:DnaJ-class molecular chaperone
MATTFKDYYATLGVPKTATPKEIKAAFRKLARQHHPDVNPGDKAAEARFKEGEVDVRLPVPVPPEARALAEALRGSREGSHAGR